MVLVYDYLELYGENAQNTYRLLIQKSYCSRPIHTKRFWNGLSRERLKAMKALYALNALYALYALYTNVLVEKRTLVEKSKI